jgi:hypothetical protein
MPSWIFPIYCEKCKEDKTFVKLKNGKLRCFSCEYVVEDEFEQKLKKEGDGDVIHSKNL